MEIVAGLFSNVADASLEPESGTDQKLPRGASGSERQTESALYVVAARSLGALYIFAAKPRGAIFAPGYKPNFWISATWMCWVPFTP